MNRFYLILFIAICALQASAQDKFITVGSGGGFAGTVTTYKITPAGKVFRGTGIGDIKYKECGKIKKSAAKKMISATAEKTISRTDFHHPGNLYYFLTYSEGGKQQTITWGDADHPVPDDIKKLYAEIQQRVSTLKYKPVK